MVSKDRKKAQSLHWPCDIQTMGAQKLSTVTGAIQANMDDLKPVTGEQV
jgi:hypothetical protein